MVVAGFLEDCQRLLKGCGRLIMVSRFVGQDAGVAEHTSSRMRRTVRCGIQRGVEHPAAFDAVAANVPESAGARGNLKGHFRLGFERPG